MHNYLCEQSEEWMTEAIMAMVHRRNIPKIIFSKIMHLSCVYTATTDLSPGSSIN